MKGGKKGGFVAAPACRQAGVGAGTRYIIHHP